VGIQRSSSLTRCSTDGAHRGSGCLLLLIVAVFFVASCTRNAPSGSSDGHSTMLEDDWEIAPPRSIDFKSCITINHALIIPVTGERRPLAMSMLSNSSIFALDEQQAKTLVGPEKASASAVVATAIVQLNVRRDRALSRHEGSWAKGREVQLDALEALRPTVGSLVPYLVRATAKHEATGQFHARTCGSSLLISHISLGDDVPPSIRVPIVVFLDDKPAQVFGSTGVAH